MPVPRGSFSGSKGLKVPALLARAIGDLSGFHPVCCQAFTGRKPRGAAMGKNLVRLGVPNTAEKGGACVGERNVFRVCFGS